MTHRFSCITVSLLICLSISVTANAQIVDIPDANLRAKVEEALGKASGDTITAADMATLTWLDANRANISDLTGLEAATNLTYLNLSDNDISDISVVSGLTNLTSLDLRANNISDISAISGLTNLMSLNLGSNRILDISVVSGLTKLMSLWLYGNNLSDISVVSGLTDLTGLYLQSNNISDISVVSGLTNLSALSLDNNDISDISPVAGLTHLRFLYLGSNNISDISVVSGLTNLAYLYLGSNDISDISAIADLTNLGTLQLRGNTISDLSPLAANTGLGSGDEVDVRSNPLNYTSIHTHIPTLQGRGVEVYFDPQASLTLLKISGDNQTRPVGAVLTNSFVVEVQDESGTAQAGIAVTFTVTAGGGTLSATNTTTDANGRAESTLTLGPSLGANTVSVAAEGSESQVTFNANAVARDGVDIPDPNLRAAIETKLGKASGDTITAADMASLTTLDASGVNISDLTGLEDATNLTLLYLHGTRISDISVVSGLTNLTSLSFGYNSISDISAVSGLTNLTDLWLNDNNISDISVVSGLTNLTVLSLRGNSISDISPISDLTNLRELRLESNSISDISPVSGLTNLIELDLFTNSISDISAISGLTNLTWLQLSDNDISDISPVTSLTNLTYLSLGDNISDLSPLVANMGLGSGDEVAVGRNPLSYASIHTHIPTLQGRGVTVYFSDQAHPALLKVSGDNQKGGAGAALASPFVVEVQDENGAALVGVSVTFTVTRGRGTLSATNTTTDANGRAESTLTLGADAGPNTVAVAADGIKGQVIFNAIADTESPLIDGDVNGDGVVNILDLVAVAASLESEPPNLMADVNGDGAVNILDLVLVAGLFENAASAPAVRPQVPETLTAVEVQGWLTDAIALEVKDVIMKRGITVLGQLLASLTPTETQLLPNYPNPFNPETWIPYRLAEDAFVTLTIYDLSGQVVRTLEVGHQMASAYESRSKAIYWDGRNDVGEQVASGVYYYHLSAGDYAATRKMLIIK